MPDVYETFAEIMQHPPHATRRGLRVAMHEVVLSSASPSFKLAGVRGPIALAGAHVDDCFVSTSSLPVLRFEMAIDPHPHNRPRQDVDVRQAWGTKSRCVGTGMRGNVMTIPVEQFDERHGTDATVVTCADEGLSTRVTLEPCQFAAFISSLPHPQSEVKALSEGGCRHEMVRGQHTLVFPRVGPADAFDVTRTEIHRAFERDRDAVHHIVDASRVSLRASALVADAEWVAYVNLLVFYYPCGPE